MTQTSFKPLERITVISTAINLPGPLAAARLRNLGATVIKVENPAGDPLQLGVPDYYAELTAGIQVVQADLKTEQGQQQLVELVSNAQVLITSIRPAAVAKLGLDQLVRRFNLVHVEIVGFDGERENEPGHDLTYQARHGSLAPPAMPLILGGDLLGGERGATAALAGLQLLRDHPEITEGTVQRVVLDHAAEWAAAPARYGITTPGAPLGGGNPFYRMYDTADGVLAVASLEPHFAQRTAQLLGSSEEELTHQFASRTNAEWMAFAREHDLPFEPVTIAGH
ncbi:CoA transferase [Auritidibacter ignavus]|uniref:CoA transferase n=1 Tax=Auritidibacter ignavus TaxID=678932 RepID=UPI0021060464|nr:CoA transferase [Auritidibacter ignavus]